MEKDSKETIENESAHEAAERIKKMIDEGRRIVEEARREAKELRKQVREERRADRKAKLRQKHRHHGDRKKEKALNLRIGKDLERKIKAEAERLNIPVSNLVRNILDDAFELVEGIGANVGNLVEDVVDNAENIADTVKSAVKDYVATDMNCGKESGDDEKSPEPDISDVPAWQEITVGKSDNCSQCDMELNPGDKAHMGVSESTGRSMFLCRHCIGSVGA